MTSIVEDVFCFLIDGCNKMSLSLGRMFISLIKWLINTTMYVKLCTDSET